MIIIGLALFSMFFGAGNIIFPPYLGMGAGPEWVPGFICYYMADIGLSLIAIFALLRNEGEISRLTGKIGTVPGKIMVSAIILCIGPCIALPRTGATVHEMFAQPLSGSIPAAVSTSVFFLIVLVLTLRESAVVDILGKFLTPALFAGLLILIIYGVVNPAGEISAESMMDNVIVSGINAGYQTMDVLAAMIFGIIIVKTVTEKGYTESRIKSRMVRNAGIIAALLLLIVYGGLTYLGATVSDIYNLRINRSELILNITEALMGRTGVILLGIIVMLACLTTAVALVSASADYFCTLSGRKLSYKLLVIVICVFSAVIANFGIDKIVMLAAPVLSLIYPGALTLIILAMFDRWVSDFTVKFAVFGAMGGSLLEILHSSGIINLGFISEMPLSSFGLGWMCFAAAAGIAGALLKRLVFDRKSMPAD